RANFIKHSVRDSVRSAEASGPGNASRMFRHILPNVSHVVLVQLSILVVAFIKAEVILSYLGLGVGVDEVSWGTMLSEAQSELILGHWWQLAAATIFMAVFVTAFSLMTDSLRDALDPKLRGLERALHHTPAPADPCSLSATFGWRFASAAKAALSSASRPSAA